MKGKEERRRTRESKWNVVAKKNDRHVLRSKMWCWNNHENCLLHLKKKRKPISLDISISLFLLVAVCNERYTKKFNTQMKPRLMTYRIIVHLRKIRGEKKTDNNIQNYVINYNALHEPCLNLQNAKEIQTWERKKWFSRNWSFTRAFFIFFWCTLLCFPFHTYSRSGHAPTNFGRLNFDIHWLKLYRRNIIYLLNMPPNNITLFLSTFCWFSLVENA